jgi:ABC-2 type transport system ATP-binding protein
MIVVNSLTKDYGARRAVDAISFDARQGEILGFLGPNGAGKTTTMRILTGYLQPTAGEASVAGFDVVDESLEVRKRVGYLPESVPLYADMRVFDQLKFMAELHNLEHADARVMETLAMVGMQDRADGYIAKLSKGMRQRVGLAQALLHEPEVLILDEPTIGLDPAQMVEVRNLVREIGKERTVLLSTHILSEAQQLCDRVLIINRGKIVAEDTPDALEARLAGAEQVELRVRGKVRQIAEKIAALDGVQETRVHNEGKLTFSFDAERELRPQVARLVIENGADLLEMKSLGMSLEDVFLRLIQEEGEKDA